MGVDDLMRGALWKPSGVVVLPRVRAGAAVPAPVTATVARRNSAVRCRRAAAGVRLGMPLQPPYAGVDLGDVRGRRDRAGSVARNSGRSGEKQVSEQGEWQ
ncbi:hypothetical protein GS885_18780 [Rhodococcus hoagii]|nr:hypothetical protein [Prescottella equi]